MATKQERECAAKIEQCIEVVKAVESAHDAVCALFGDGINSPLFDAINTCISAYVQAIADNIGDNGEWLAWHVWENNCGANALLATTPSCRRGRRIKTALDLAKIICAP